MSCLFGLLAAHVTAVELPGRSLELARAEIKKWHLQDLVSPRYYDGDLRQIGGAEFDFIFSKSVLVIVPNLLRFSVDLAALLRPDGRLLAAENMQRGTSLRKLREHVLRVLTAGRAGKNDYSGFHGVTPAFIGTLGQAFEVIRYQESYGLVAAIEAKTRTFAEKPNELVADRQ
jgi:protein-L-isoaspartate O-methyltransferase